MAFGQFLHSIQQNWKQSQRWSPLAQCLVLLLVLLGGLACQSPSTHGLYLSMRHTYYEPALAPLERWSVRRRLDTLYPELGIVEPETGVLRDQGGTVQVALLSEQSSPLLQRLKNLPQAHQARFHQNIQVVPWLFVEGMDPKRTRPLELDFYDPLQRQKLLEVIRQLHLLGFSGVHLDVEPLLSAQVPALCSFLEDVRQQTSPQFRRSLFTPKLLPPSLGGEVRHPEQVHPGFMWDSLALFEELAQCSDELVVPLYDYGSLVQTPDQYQRWVRETAQALRYLPTYTTRIKLALPAYRLTAQHSAAERAALALPLLQNKELAPAGVVYFQFTGEKTDWWP